MAEIDKKRIERRIERFKGYYSHINDFSQIIELCRIIELNYSDENKQLINSALYRYCVITYAKAFNNGSRSKIDEKIFKDLPGDPIGTHRYYMNLRNKSIAHREDSFDSIQLGAIKNDKNEVIGLCPFEIRKVIDQIEGIIQLRLLSDTACEYLKEQIENEKEEIIQLVKDNPWLDSGNPIGARLAENGYLEKLRKKDV